MQIQKYRRTKWSFTFRSILRFWILAQLLWKWFKFSLLFGIVGFFYRFLLSGSSFALKPLKFKMVLPAVKTIYSSRTVFPSENWQLEARVGQQSITRGWSCTCHLLDREGGSWVSIGKTIGLMQFFIRQRMSKIIRFGPFSFEQFFGPNKGQRQRRARKSFDPTASPASLWLVPHF